MSGVKKKTKLKEKDQVDPPALSRIRHFIMSKIAYDLKQIQYAKQYLDKHQEERLGGREGREHLLKKGVLLTEIYMKA